MVSKASSVLASSRSRGRRQQTSARATVRAEHGNVRYTGNDTRVASALIAARRVAAERGQRGSVSQREHGASDAEQRDMDEMTHSTGREGSKQTTATDQLAQSITSIVLSILYSKLMKDNQDKENTSESSRGQLSAHDFQPLLCHWSPVILDQGYWRLQQCMPALLCDIWLVACS